MLFSLLKKYQKFIKFSLVGFSSTVIDVGGLWILVEFAHLPVLLSSAISFCLAATNGFWWNKHWTFKNEEKKYLKQFSYFFLISLGGLFINLILLKVLISLNVYYLLAKILIVGVVVSWNYLWNNLVTFRKE
jgi:putative flippase GtrA